jgi:hypothetical protein
MPRLLLPTRLLLAALAVSALVGLACAKLNTSGNLRLGAAATHVLIDDPDASIVDRGALPKDVSALQKRAELYGRLIVTAPVVEAIGRRIGVPPEQISGVARTTSDVPIPLTEPGSEERASQIRDSRAPYRLELQSDPSEPVLAIYSQAPSTDAAQRLANAATLGLQDYLQALAREQGFPQRELPILRQLGNARGSAINTRAPLVIGGLTFLTAFALTFVGLLGLVRLLMRRIGADAVVPAPRPIEPSRGDGDWPHTRRVLPWSIACFIAMIWLVPFDKIKLAFATPVDLWLDRLVLPVIVAIWLLAFAAGRRFAPQLRITGVHLALGAFLACAALSVVLDASYLSHTGELTLALKQVPLLFSYMSIFVIVASSVRRTEVPAFMTYTLVLAVICGIGVVVEFRLGINVFNVVSAQVLPAGLFHFVADGSGKAVDSLGRPWVVGPAGFGVETVGMMTMALPIAVVGLLGSSTRKRRILYGLAIVVLVAAIFATQRKSALLAPVFVMLTLAYYRRRELLSLAPLGLVMAVMVAAISPGAVHGVISQFTRSDRSQVATVSDRAADYDAIRPDVWTHLLFGRGYGSYAHTTYRILDSEILGRTVETGVLGLAAFVLIALSVIFAARKTVSARDPQWAPIALVGTAAAVCFLELSTLYDEMGYPHGTYIFLCLAGFVVIVGAPQAQPDERLGKARVHRLAERRVRSRQELAGSRERAARAG